MALDNMALEDMAFRSMALEHMVLGKDRSKDLHKDRSSNQLKRMLLQLMKPLIKVSLT